MDKLSPLQEMLLKSIQKQIENENNKMGVKMPFASRNLRSTNRMTTAPTISRRGGVINGNKINSGRQVFYPR